MLCGYQIELMLSAGPRKSERAYLADPGSRELGEDAGGIWSCRDFTLFWLADGTSDEPALGDIFSARTLARDAGASLLKASAQLYREQDEPLFCDIVSLMLAILKGNWKDKLQVLHEQARNEYLRALLPRLVLCSDGKQRASWSTTFVAGRIEHQSRRLSCVTMGDSRMVVQVGEPEAGAILAPNFHRLFLQMVYNPSHGGLPDIQLVPQSVAPELVVQLDDVKQFLCLTDGTVDMPLQAFHQRNRSIDLSRSADLAREDRSTTYDDRGMLYGKLIG